MFSTYLKPAIRSLKRNRTHSLLNIFGLAIGMAACIVIMLFVFYENSFDNMHHRNIYRLNTVQKFANNPSPDRTAITLFQMGPKLKNEFPEILKYSRVDQYKQYQLTYGEKSVFYPQTCFVDTSFLRLFEFPLLKGDRQTALQKPNSIVLTESAARTLFGDLDPMGKTVSHIGGDTLLFTVTGVLKDLPANSQLQFDALQSYSTIYKPDWMDQTDNWVTTYLELAPNTNMAALEKKFSVYTKTHLPPGNLHINNELFLQPLRDVHANSADLIYDDLNYQKFDSRYIDIIMAIGGLVLLIACINFVNLATARSAERAKEVGIRKSIGALRIQLGFQFLGETVLFALIALAIALGLVSLTLPYIDKFSGRDLSLLFLQHPGLLAAVLLGTILLGGLSGLYPAVYLSSFQPAKVLKSSGESGRSKGTFRNILVVGQFASAIFLMIATVLVFRQLNYIQQRDPGFDRDQIVTIKLHGITSRKYALLKQQLSASPLVAGVTGAFDQLGSHLTTLGLGFWPGNAPMRTMTCTGLFVDPDYLKVYKIQLVAGRNFTHLNPKEGVEFVVNESLAKQLLKDQPGAPLSSLIGKHFGGDTLGSIVGVVKDFNFNSLRYKIEPLFLLNQTEGGFSTMSVKINGRQASQAISLMGSVWKNVLPAYPFTYEFLDDHFRELYKTDAQVSRIVAMMAALAIVISCLGLFGLASFSAEKRTKEIGIRKILGASVQDVVVLLSRHFIGLVLIANVIAWPLAWLALHRWIQDYAYRVAISWWVFVAAGAAALVIALATVSYHAISAALSNPVETLRAE